MANTLKQMLTIQIGAKNYNLIHAFKIERVISHIKFLRECRRREVIPRGFNVCNKLKNTGLNCVQAQRLAERHSMAWIKITINQLYQKLYKLQLRPIYPLLLSEYKILNHYRYLIRLVKRSKMDRLRTAKHGSDATIDKPTGFVNKSTHLFTEAEMTLLNKGPSYVPPPAVPNTTQKIMFKAELQACYERFKRKDATLANSGNVAEFLIGAKRITEETSQCLNNRNPIIRTVKDIKKVENMVIIPSDKTKRLVAMDSNDYKELIASALNPQDKTVNNVKPSTRQIYFNKKLASLMNKYPNSNCQTLLSKCKVSEPLPSLPYALPKDHKSGQIKGRPIISTLNSVVRPLSKLIANALNPLVKLNIESHLESTESFLCSLSDVSVQDEQWFGSLDVINLYGSIPLSDTTTTKGLITVATEFFARYGLASCLAEMTPADFEVILRLCLFEDVYLFNGIDKQQTVGIAMGNCAAPPLAIIFMDYVESEIRRLSPQVTYWTRYIDDIFVIANGDPNVLVNCANAIHPQIQFTLEAASDGKLPFLDTLVTLSPNRKFEFQLYIKPTHSGTCLPYESHVPMNRKHNLVNTELERANRISSEQFKQVSKQLIKTKLCKNGYSSEVIQKIEIRKLQQDEQDKVKQDPITYIKIPFLSETQRYRTLNLARKTGVIDKLRFIFTTERPLAWKFREKRESIKCPLDCIGCATALKPNVCHNKFTIYNIECTVCNAVYIGQSARSISSRISEHTKCNTSAVFIHMHTHGQFHTTAFKWKIISICKNFHARLAAETFFIASCKARVMNGCTGMETLRQLAD